MTDSDVEELSVSPSAPSGQAKFFLGFDFGTTHSGIAYAFENCPEDLEVIQEWPEGGNNSSQKVPTLISFRGDTALWGYMVNEMKPCIRGFKLLLDKSKNLSYGPAIESEAIIQSLDKKPVDIAGIYLKKLMSHARTILCRRGIESVLDTMDVQYIVTVPAVWSDKAKDLTMQAARLAGIPQANLVLLSEPEAAAVDAIRTIQPNSITQDDCFIVCDAGGGTVDLITYKVTQKDPLRLEEVTEGTGAICGSTILDNAFQKLLIETISKTHYDQLSDEAKRIPMRIWEKDIKPNYAGQDLEDADADDFLDAGYIIPVPGVPDCPEKHIRNGMLYFESEQVEKIFRPVVEQIKSLISDQVLGAKLAGIPPKAVILVGGLGSSEYVFKALKTCFTGMEVMQPRNAWTSVVRGAVYRGLEGNQVDNRKARCHYGVSYRTPFNPDEHEQRDKEWCKYEEEWKAGNQMDWYIRKGESTSENKPISIGYYRCVPINHSFVFHEELMMSCKDQAPKVHSKKSVRVHCELVSDLSKIPKRLFLKKKNSSGQEYYDVRYSLVLTPLSASMNFELVFKGINYGKVSASYF